MNVISGQIGNAGQANYSASKVNKLTRTIQSGNKNQEKN